MSSPNIWVVTNVIQSPSSGDFFYTKNPKELCHVNKQTIKEEFVRWYSNVWRWYYSSKYLSNLPRVPSKIEGAPYGIKSLLNKFGKSASWVRQPDRNSASDFEFRVILFLNGLPNKSILISPPIALWRRDGFVTSVTVFLRLS